LLGDSLENGTYNVDRVYINGNVVGSGHRVFSELAGAVGTWVIDGNQATFSHRSLPGFSANSLTVEFRVRGGFLEQRCANLTNNMWIRENGSAASAYISTRVEDGQIVVRFGEESDPGRRFGGRVYIFYTLAVASEKV